MMTVIPRLLMNTNPIVRKSNELISARYKLSVWEQRLILVLLSDINLNDEDFRSYRIEASRLAQAFQLNSSKSFYGKLQEAADSLVGKTVQLGDDEQISKTVSWLSYVEYVKGSGLIYIEFHKALKPYLLQLKKHFTQYHLSHVINFKSQYSIRLYEFLKMEAYKAKNGTFKVTRSLSEYRASLGIALSEYPVTADLKKRAILPPVREISEQTDLEIKSVSYGKTNRKITSVTFHIIIRSDNEVKKNQEEIAKRIESETDKKHPLLEKMQALGFPEDMAVKYKNRYGVKRIERNLTYTLAKQQEGVVKSIPSYLNKAITEDLGVAWEALELKKKEEQVQQVDTLKKREALAEEAHQQRIANLLKEKESGGELIKK